MRSETETATVSTLLQLAPNVIYGESCVANDEAEQFRATLDSEGLQVIQNRGYGSYLTAPSIEDGALVYLAGDALSEDNIWAFVST